jgi:hypothetical protein
LSEGPRADKAISIIANDEWCLFPFAKVVTQLIESGKWREIPSLEDQFPDDRMPRAFFEHWGFHHPMARVAGADGNELRR